VESHDKNQFQTRHSVNILIVRVINHLIKLLKRVILSLLISSK